MELKLTQLVKINVAALFLFCFLGGVGESKIYMWWTRQFHSVRSNKHLPIQRGQTHGVHKWQLTCTATNMDSLQHTEMKYVQFMQNHSQPLSLFSCLFHANNILCPYNINCPALFPISCYDKNIRRSVQMEYNHYLSLLPFFPLWIKTGQVSSIIKCCSMNLT